MHGISCLRRDRRGGAGVKFVLAATLAAIPLLYPAQTLSMLDQARSQWEQLWTIDGLAGRPA